VTDVLVVGGGVVGCAVARALAPDRDVRLVERDSIAAGATGRAAGEVTTRHAYADFPRVARHADAFFREYDGVPFRERPSLELVAPDREGEARRRVDRLAADGTPVDFLPPEAVERRYSRLTLDEFAGAVRHGETGFLDPAALARSLAADAESRGATVETGVAVDSVLVADGRVRGAATADGDRRAETVIAAAGWRTEPLLRDTVQLPVRPYRTHCAVARPETPLDAAFPMGSVPDADVYFRPRPDGDLLVHGRPVALDPAATDADGERSVAADADDAFRGDASTVLRRILQDGDGARVVDDWAGVDGATPDVRPIIAAPDEAPDGLVVATGFHGRGVMTAPAAAAAVRSLVTGESAPFSLDSFRLGRFDDRTTEFPLFGIPESEDERE
jgi:glycine/D-amino acid oxidase-like deaminating enzyme